jgi:uncharacterized protein
MATGPFNRYATAGRAVDQATFDVGLRQHMLRVYNYMTVGLVVTALVAFFGAQSPALMGLVFGTPLKWVVMLAPLGFILVLSWKVQQMSMGTIQALFFGFCALMGLSMMSIFAVYTGQSIARVFFITAGMFAATSLYGYTTKTDLARFGSFLIMGLIGLIIASVVNIFLGSSALQFAVSVISVLVFTGLTAWDTQNIKESYAESYGEETNHKMAVMGALSLYLNFINLFRAMLSLFGSRE